MQQGGSTFGNQSPQQQQPGGLFGGAGGQQQNTGSPFGGNALQNTQPQLFGIGGGSTNAGSQGYRR